MPNVLCLVEANVPPLGIYLINGSPRTVGDAIEADFVTTRPVTSVRCFLRSLTTRIVSLSLMLLLVSDSCRLNHSRFKWSFKDLLCFDEKRICFPPFLQ